MQDDFVSLFAFNRWANAKMLDACRKLTPEQYTAEPVPGWSSVRFTVWHIAIVTDGWLRTLANDPDQSFRARPKSRRRPPRRPHRRPSGAAQRAARRLTGGPFCGRRTAGKITHSGQGRTSSY